MLESAHEGQREDKGTQDVLPAELLGQKAGTSKETTVTLEGMSKDLKNVVQLIVALVRERLICNGGVIWEVEMLRIQT